MLKFFHLNFMKFFFSSYNVFNDDKLFSWILSDGWSTNSTSEALSELLNSSSTTDDASLNSTAEKKAPLWSKELFSYSYFYKIAFSCFIFNVFCSYLFLYNSKKNEGFRFYDLSFLFEVSVVDNFSNWRLLFFLSSS